MKESCNFHITPIRLHPCVLNAKILVAMRFFTAILSIGLALSPLLANAQSTADSPPADRIVTRDIPLGNADLETVQGILAENKSPSGTFSILKIKRVARISDTPENIEAAREMIAAVSAQASRNIRIDIFSNKDETQSASGLAVSGRINTGNVRGAFGPNPPAIGATAATGTFTNNYNNVPSSWGAVAAPTFFFGGAAVAPPPVILPARLAPPGTQLVVPNGWRVVSWNGTAILTPPVAGPVPGFPAANRANAGGVTIGNRRGAININPLSQRSSSSTRTSQFIIVGNGRTGSISVAREVPVVTSLTTILTGAGITRFPDLHWEKVGTELMVRATAVGDMITIDVTPRISNLAPVQTNTGNVFGPRPITGFGPSIELTELTSTVTVPNGGTTTIGGFNNASENFNRFFFGGSRGSTSTTGSITLKATIQ